MSHTKIAPSARVAAPARCRCVPKIKQHLIRALSRSVLISRPAAPAHEWWFGAPGCAHRTSDNAFVSSAAVCAPQTLRVREWGQGVRSGSCQAFPNHSGPSLLAPARAASSLQGLIPYRPCRAKVSASPLAPSIDPCGEWNVIWTLSRAADYRAAATTTRQKEFRSDRMPYSWAGHLIRM